MTAEEMIKLNNERRKLLNEKNREYYEKMLLYLRFSPIPEKTTEELLLEMLDHLLIAQQEGRSAEDVFGTDPEAYCKEVVRSVGKRSPFGFRRYAFIFNMGLCIVFFMDAIFRLAVHPLLNRFIDLPQPKGFSVDYFLTPIVMCLGVDLLLMLMRESTFKRFRTRILLRYLIPIALTYILPIILFIFLNKMIPVIPIPAWMSLLIGVVLWGLHKWMYKRVEIF